MRDREKENAVREALAYHWENPSQVPAHISAEDVQGLLEEIDYLREQVANGTAYASQLKRRLAGEPAQSVAQEPSVPPA